MPPRLEKLGHVVLQVRDMALAKRFYIEQLGMRVRADLGFICFLVCGEDHHDLAIVQMRKDPGATVNSPLVHVAFRVASFADLLHAYRELKAAGAEFGWVVDHGPTRSFYVRDPDGNEVELYHDKYPTEHWTEFMQEPRWAHDAFLKHPLGIPIDLEAEAHLLGVG